MPLSVTWKDDVDDHDFDAALAYLSLRLDGQRAAAAVALLRAAELTTRRANDILRATGYRPLPWSDPGMGKIRGRIAAGHRLSPVLVVSYTLGGDVADGYHRCSAAYNLDPFGVVPLRLAHVLPETGGGTVYT